MIVWNTRGPGIQGRNSARMFGVLFGRFFLGVLSGRNL